MATITIDIDEDTEALLHKVLSSTSLSASQLVCEALKIDWKKLRMLRRSPISRKSRSSRQQTAK